MSWRVAICGDTALGVHGVVHLLPSNAKLLEASSSLQFINERVEILEPEILIVTLAQPSLSWATSIIRLATRTTSQIVLLTPEDSPDLPPHVISVAINGLNADRIASVLEKIMIRRGEHSFESVSHESHRAAAKALSSREMEVLRLVAGGVSTKEIASRLCISARTVDFHRANIQSKTRLRSVAELTRYAIEKKIAEQELGKNWSRNSGSFRI